jgi:murein DD-endopeptidase MepM/ murein hydrolase activator NlpD
MSVAAMSFIMLLTIGVSIPANAFGNVASGASSAGGSAANARAQTASASGVGVGVGGAQDSFSVTEPVVLKPKVNVASGAGEPTVSGVSFIPAPGPVIWPSDESPRIGRGVTDAHHGQDLLMAGGTPVHAIADGTVSVSTTEGSLGTYVVVASTIAGHSVTSLYAHLQSGSVNVGDVVTQGQTVGLVGSTGAATANLLYLRILQDGALCDTITFIAGNPAGGAAPH